VTAFVARHRGAPLAERTACRDDLVALRREDAALQDLAAGLLGELDAACRSSLGASPASTSDYRDEPVLACLDRRA